MKLDVSPEAARWYIEEMDLKKGDSLRFHTSLYGQSVHPNFSLGIVKDTSDDAAISTTTEGITFYFDENDAWFLNGYHMKVDLIHGEIVIDLIEEINR